MRVVVHCETQIEARRLERLVRDLPGQIEHAEGTVALLEAVQEPSDIQTRALGRARARLERLQATEVGDLPVAVETRGLNNDERAQISKDRQHTERPVR